MAHHPFIIYREKKKPPMSQAALARKLGVSRSLVNRIEMGSRQVGIDILAKVAKKTGIPLSALRPDLKALLKK